MAAATTLIADRYIPSLPTDWAAEGDVKRFKSLSKGTHRSLEPVGPQYLAHARRMRHNRTFSEDDRIEAEARAKKVDAGDDDGDISEPEDPSLLLREAKDWKVRISHETGLRISCSGEMMLTIFFSSFHRPKTTTPFSA